MIRTHLNGKPVGIQFNNLKQNKIVTRHIRVYDGHISEDKLYYFTTDPNALETTDEEGGTLTPLCNPYTKKVRVQVQVRGTRCDIVSLNNQGQPEKVIASGSAWCNHKDNFKRETGRLVSLGKAISELQNSNLLTSKSKEIIWSSYKARDSKHQVSPQI